MKVLSISESGNCCVPQLLLYKQELDIRVPKVCMRLIQLLYQQSQDEYKLCSPKRVQGKWCNTGSPNPRRVFMPEKELIYSETTALPWRNSYPVPSSFFLKLRFLCCWKRDIVMRRRIETVVKCLHWNGKQSYPKKHGGAEWAPLSVFFLLNLSRWANEMGSKQPGDSYSCFYFPRSPSHHLTQNQLFCSLLIVFSWGEDILLEQVCSANNNKLFFKCIYLNYFKVYSTQYIG